MLEVTLLDKETGAQKLNPYTDIDVFQWTENNWSCDCNREIAFLDKGESLDFNKPCKSDRYLVVDASGNLEGYAKEDFIRECNSNYKGVEDAY